MRPGQPFVATVGPILAADPDGLTLSQTAVVAGINNLVLSGAFTTGTPADNICLSQTPGGAGNLLLNGSLAASPTGVAIAYLGTPMPAYVTSAADISNRTLTFTGTVIGTTGLVGAVETITGPNASRVQTLTSFYTITQIAISGVAAGALTVGRGGVGTLDFLRQLVVTTSGNDTGITYTVVGTNLSNDPISSTIAGPNATTGLFPIHFKTVTSFKSSGAAAGTVTLGTTGVASSATLYPDRFQNPFNIGLGCTVVGTVNYDVEHTFDNILTVADPVWFDNSGISGETANTDGNYAFAVNGIRLLLNSGTGSVKFTAIQSSW